MIGLDTNIIVRFVVADDAAQCEAARTLFASLTVEDPGYIGLINTAEFIWVLSRTYGFPPNTVTQVLHELLGCAELVFEAAGDIEAALFESASTGADLPDALIARRNANAGCSTTYTFDRTAARLPRMTALNTADQANTGTPPRT